MGNASTASCASHEIFSPEGDMDTITTKTSTVDTNNDDEVQIWLDQMKLSEYYSVFIENGFDDMSYMTSISVEILNQMKISKIGHQTIILAEVKKLKDEPPCQTLSSTLSSETSDDRTLKNWSLDDYNNPNGIELADNTLTERKYRWRCKSCYNVNTKYDNICLKCGQKCGYNPEKYTKIGINV